MIEIFLKKEKLIKAYVLNTNEHVQQVKMEAEEAIFNVIISFEDETMGKYTPAVQKLRISGPLGWVFWKTTITQQACPFLSNFA